MVKHLVLNTLSGRFVEPVYNNTQTIETVGLFAEHQAVRRALLPTVTFFTRMFDLRYYVILDSVTA